jgi:hypothetical protein
MSEVKGFKNFQKKIPIDPADAGDPTQSAVT